MKDRNEMGNVMILTSSLIGNEDDGDWEEVVKWILEEAIQVDVVTFSNVPNEKLLDLVPFGGIYAGYTKLHTRTPWTTNFVQLQTS